MSYNILTLRKMYLVEVEMYSSWSISSILGVYVSFLFILLHLLVWLIESYTSREDVHVFGEVRYCRGPSVCRSLALCKACHLGLIASLTFNILDAKSACLFASLSRGNISFKNWKKICGSVSTNKSIDWSVQYQLPLTRWVNTMSLSRALSYAVLH